MTRRRKKPARPVADPTRIAVLEWELFGIEPKPGTAAAAMVGMQRLGEALRDQPSFVEVFANPNLIGAERR